MVVRSEQTAREQDAPFKQEEQTKRDVSVKEGKSSLVSRNVTIGAHRTSVRLEPDMWTGLREICRREHVTLHDVATVVSTRKAENTSLTAAIRVFVMAYFRAAATEEGHNRAGHGPGGRFMASFAADTLSSLCEDEDSSVTQTSRLRFVNAR